VVIAMEMTVDHPLNGPVGNFADAIEEVAPLTRVRIDGRRHYECRRCLAVHSPPIAKPVMISTDAHAADEMSPINIAPSILLPQAGAALSSGFGRDMWWSGVLRCYFCC
jgi:hypothetical protein